jgi:hypothetical protein
VVFFPHLCSLLAFGARQSEFRGISMSSFAMQSVAVYGQCLTRLMVSGVKALGRRCSLVVVTPLFSHLNRLLAFGSRLAPNWRT